MKRRLILLVNFLMLGAQIFLPVAAGQKPLLIPLPLSEADRAYREKGADAFLPALLRGAFTINGDAAVKIASTRQQVESVMNTLKRIEQNYNPYRGLEPIDSIEISASTRIVYYVLNYEKGPLYGVLTAYTTDHGEIVTGFLVHTELRQVVPQDLLINRALAKKFE